jgi:2'-5' RNA ligase
MAPLFAVVSLLDEPHGRQVEKLWTELAQRCGVHGIYATPFPHFSYHVATSYDLTRLEAALRRAARQLRPFRVRTTGLGIFQGKTPVVYVPVVRSPELTALHRRLWPLIDKAAGGTLDYYRPEHWVPHITLGHGDIQPEHLPDVVRVLSEHDLTWELTVSNLAVISSSGAPQGLHMRIPLGH